MKIKSRLRELPEMIQSYLKGFLHMIIVVWLLSLLAVILHFKER